MAQAVHRSHPTPAVYWAIALFLAVVTAIEVAVPYFSVLDPVRVPLLIVLAIVKFGTVVAYFMHLRYDKKLYRTLFLFGVIGVIPLFVVVLATMHAF